MKITINIPDESGINTSVFIDALREWMDDWAVDEEDYELEIESEEE